MDPRSKFPLGRRRRRPLATWSVVATVALVAGVLPAVARQPAASAQQPPPGTPPTLDDQWAELQALAVAAGDPDSDLTIDGAPDPDGVADSVERVLGTDPALSDTDGDTLSDGDELEHGLDPRRADTNDDGLEDNIEAAGADGRIDPGRVHFAEEPDNDHDGVPDEVDESPFQESSALDRLQLDVATSGKPGYVDVQVVPEDLERLDQALSGYDWPDGDGGGLMQDRGGAPEAGEARQDVQLVPMLEVALEDRGPFDRALAAPASELKRYGIMAPPAVPPAGVTGLRLRAGDLDDDGTPDDLRLTGTRTLPLTGATGVVAGDDHTCVVTERPAGDGEPTPELWCWGDNSSGELGTGEPGGYLSDVGGTITTYPYSDKVVSGMADPAREPHPAVLDGVKDWTLTAGSRATCVENDQDGAPVMTCWGENGAGQLGPFWGEMATSENVLDPRTRQEMATPALTLGELHSCRLTLPDATGRIKLQCRGSNSDRQLGVATGSSRAWVDVSGGLAADPTGASAYVAPAPIDAGERHTCAIVNTEWSSTDPWTFPETGRRVVCWGANDQFQTNPAGYLASPPDDSDVTTPVQIDLLGARPTAVSVGARFSCVLNGADQVQCWGDNDHGQSNGGAPSDVAWFAKGVGLPTRAPGERLVSLTTGDAHACVLTSAGRVICWGDNRSGQIGTGTSGEVSVASRFINAGFPAGAKVVDVAAGANHTCAVADTGEVRCWGANERGQSGTGATAATVPTPTRVTTRHLVETTGTSVGLVGPATGEAVWSPEADVRATENRDDPAVPASFGPSGGFGTGTAAAVPVVGDFDDDGDDDVFLWSYQLSTGRLLYRFGWGPDVWGPVQQGPVLPVGANGNVATFTDVDDDGDRDIVYAAVDDLANRDLRHVLGTATGAGDAATFEWGPVQRHRGSGTSDLLYVPLGPVLDATGATRALTGRVFLPASLPVGALPMEVRLVWTVLGRTDDPDYLSVAGDGGSEAVTTLATYPDRFTVTGLGVTEQLGVDAAVASQQVPDGPDRWTQMAQTGMILANDWLRGTTVNGVPAEIGLGDLPAAFQAAGLSIALADGAYAHEDAAALGLHQLETTMLDTVPPGRTVAVMSAVETRRRQASMGDDGLVSWTAPDRLAVDLRTAPVTTMRTFDADYYDTTGEEPVQLRGVLLERLNEWGFDDRLDAVMATLLVTWDAPETVLAAVDGTVVPRTQTDPQALSDAKGVLDHWGWGGLTTALGAAAMLDRADFFYSVRTWNKAFIGMTGVRASLGGDQFVEEALTALTSSRSATLSRDTLLAAGTKTLKRIKLATEWIEGTGTLLDVAVNLVSYLVVAFAAAQSESLYLLTQAMVELALNLVLVGLEVLAEFALGAAMAGIAALLGASGPPGWVAAVIVFVVFAVLWVLEEFTDVKWFSKLRDLIVGLLVDADAAGLATFAPAFMDLRSLLADVTGDGLTVGDSVGLAADLHNREFPAGAVQLPGLGGTDTWIQDMTMSWFSGGLWATPGVGQGWPAANAPVPDPRTAGDWTGDETTLIDPVVSEAPPRWPELDPSPGRTGVRAWVVPGAPDPDYHVTYQVETRAEIAGWQCEKVFGVLDCDRYYYDLSGEEIDVMGEPSSEFTDPQVVRYDVLPRTLDGFLDWSVLTRMDNDADGIIDDVENPTMPGEPDTDSDGLLDGAELNLLGSNPVAADADGDGANDSEEWAHRTLTDDPDTDDDGLLDGQEIDGWTISFLFRGRSVTAHVDSDPLRENSDAGHLGGDTLGDAAELNTLNPRSSDTDGDGTPDGCTDQLSLTLSGSVTGKVEGCTRSGDLVVRSDGFGVVSVTGTATTASLTGGASTASVTFALNRFWILPWYFGTVRVADPAATTDVTAVAFFSPVSGGGKVAYGSLNGLTGTFPRLGFFTLWYRVQDLR